MSSAALTRLAPEQDSHDHAEAASLLFERHRRRIHAFCLSRTRNATDAEDATQTTFMYALTGLKRGVVPEFELGWLLRIAENVCHSMRGRAHRRYERGELPDDLAGDSNGDPAIVSERLATVAAALETLPETQRRAIVLREWRGLSYDDIAEQLETSHAAVETLLFRARRSMAKRVASVGQFALQLPQVSRIGRWALGSGAEKAMTVVAISIGAGMASDVAPPSADPPSASPELVVAFTQPAGPRDRVRAKDPQPASGQAPESGVPSPSAPATTPEEALPAPPRAGEPAASTESASSKPSSPTPATTPGAVVPPSVVETVAPLVPTEAVTNLVPQLAPLVPPLPPLAPHVPALDPAPMVVDLPLPLP